MLVPVLVISLGASIGAVLRWLLGLSLNSVWPLMSLGTLVANSVGGYFAGISLALFASLPVVAQEWRLLIVTGFLGGLTTFSAFSAEVVALALQGRFVASAATIAAHLAGSLIMTMAGIGTVLLIQRV